MAERLTSALGAAAEQAASDDPLTDEILAGALPPLKYAFDVEWGGFGSAPKFPPSAAIGFLLRLHARTGERGRPCDGPRHARRHVAGRHARPRRRRLSPLRRRPGLARPALREDALRQRPARHGLPRGVGGDRRAALPRRGRGDARLPAARDAAPRGRVRLGAGRRHRRRRGLHLRLDAGRPGARAGRRRTLRRRRRYYGVTAAGNFEGATVLRISGERLRRTWRHQGADARGARRAAAAGP